MTETLPGDLETEEKVDFSGAESISSVCPSSLFLTTISEIESNLPGEDRNSVRLDPQISAWAVVDGHGGSNACELVNERLIDHISGKVKELPCLNDTDAVLEVIDQSFQHCDNMVLERALKKVRLPLSPNKSDAKCELMRTRDAGRPGCCVVVVLIIGEYIYAANVGYVMSFKSFNLRLFKFIDLICAW